MSQKMILKVLLLLEGLVAPFKAALELAFVTLEMPVKLALAYKLAIEADWALKL